MTRRAFGHHLNPADLNGSVLGRACTQSPTAGCGSGRLDRIEGVGLAVVSASLAVYLDGLQASPTQEPGQSNAIGTGSLDPGHQGPVARSVGLERSSTDQPAQGVQGRGDAATRLSRPPVEPAWHPRRLWLDRPCGPVGVGCLSASMTPVARRAIPTGRPGSDRPGQFAP
jgi:hypothetical protein